jgi:regulator of nucleoside diphosphate kinase
MRPTIALTDYNTLRSLTQNISPKLKMKEVAQLEIELNRATVIDDDRVGKNIVRLNSLVEIKDAESGKITSLEIVLPDHADLKERKISILAPISIALLGFKEGDNIEWQMPGGLKRIRIISVMSNDRVFPTP